ncbi:MAG: glycosyltransferase, partial [Lachnospiraceae bacterium]|nr:glycosyltransferase [Lachnospiraceae bacterium]
FIGKEKYDVLIAYMHGAPVKVLSGCPDKGAKRIAWLHNGDVQKALFFDFWLSEKKAFRAYDSFHAIAAVADSVRSAFEEYTGIRGKTHTVYNTNDFKKIEQMAASGHSFPQGRGLEICAAGKLAEQKGFDRLIGAAAKLREEGYSFHVSIMGTGAEDYKEQLIKMIRDLKAEGYVELMGFQSNPFAIMAASDLYVLSSRWEGLATVLTEALIVGTPIVATDVSGTKEVLGENSEYGLVMPNSEEGIYEGIKRFLDDPGLLEQYRKKASERAEFFRPEKTVAQAEKLIDAVIGQD